LKPMGHNDFNAGLILIIYDPRKSHPLFWWM